MGLYEVQAGSRHLKLWIDDDANCSHTNDIRDVTPSADGCEECLQLGDEWFHLRICQKCGHVGCCDESKNTHATKHHRATGHPIVQSFEPEEEWMYCYPDDAFMEPVT